MRGIVPPHMRQSPQGQRLRTLLKLLRQGQPGPGGQPMPPRYIGPPARIGNVPYPHPPAPLGSEAGGFTDSPPPPISLRGPGRSF